MSTIDYTMSPGVDPYRIATTICKMKATDLSREEIEGRIHKQLDELIYLAFEISVDMIAEAKERKKMTQAEREELVRREREENPF